MYAVGDPSIPKAAWSSADAGLTIFPTNDSLCAKRSSCYQEVLEQKHSEHGT